MTEESRYEVRYRNGDGQLISLCLEADHATEAIERARHEVPVLRIYPGRIQAVIRGCS